MSFATLFTFARSRSAPYRDSNGTLATAAIDAPRFDHDLAGAPLGLIVDEGGEAGDRDRLALADPIGVSGPATVFHAVTRDDGAIDRRAYYTMNADQLVGQLLRQAARHRTIGVAPGFVAVRNGFVRYRGVAWEPPAVIAAGVAVLADAGDRPLLAG